MGTNNLPTRSTGQTILEQFFNVFKTALTGDIVPRNNSGDPESKAGDIGNQNYKFKRAHIEVGYFFPGMTIPVHTFNNTITPGHGWMKCDGRIINKANYDAEHGAGSWDELIISSPLEGKYMPNLNNKYLVGSSSTTQDGSSAITSVGNNNHQVNLNHSHTVNSHNHQWYKHNPSSPGDESYNSGGSLDNLNPNSGDSGFSIQATGSTGELKLESNYYTSNTSPGTSSSGSSSQSIQPDSIQKVFYMRII